jgi:hypothetical protein
MKSNAHLQILRVTGCSDVSSDIFVTASKYCINLQELNVHRCFDVSSIDNSFELLTKTCTTLQHLNVSNTAIDSAFLAQMQPKNKLTSKIQY